MGWQDRMEAKHDSKYQRRKRSGSKSVSRDRDQRKILEGHTGENIKNGLYISREEKQTFEYASVP
jgi:hypothetical protein